MGSFACNNYRQWCLGKSPVWSISTLAHPPPLFSKIIQRPGLIECPLMLAGFMLMFQPSFRKVLSWWNMGFSDDLMHIHILLILFFLPRGHTSSSSLIRAHQFHHLALRCVMFCSWPDSSQTTHVNWKMNDRYCRVQQSKHAGSDDKELQLVTAFYFQSFLFVLGALQLANMSVFLKRAAHFTFKWQARCRSYETHRQHFSCVSTLLIFPVQGVNCIHPVSNCNL